MTNSAPNAKAWLPGFPAGVSLLLLLGAFHVAGAQMPQQAKGVDAATAGVAELRREIARVENLLPQLPDRAAGLYLLSKLKEQAGETDRALNLLQQCIAFHEGFDPTGSPSLSKMRGSKPFDDLVETVHRAFPVVRQARLAFVTKEKDLVPEGLAFDARRDVFYLSSLNRRKIVRINSKGEASDFVPPQRNHLLPVLGIRVNPRDGTVWAASWSEDSGKSELLRFDASGTLLDRYAPNDGESHGFNDLVIRETGEVVLTDSVSNKIYRFAPSGGTFAAVPVYRQFSAPNGIALADDDHQIFVADDFGIVRVDLDSGASGDLIRSPGSTLAGVDGLYWHKRSLIAIQNGIGPARVAVFRLSPDATRVDQTTVVENRSAFTSTPTTGAIRGDDFYFMANSQGDNLNGDKVVDKKKLERVRIGVLRLP